MLVCTNISRILFPQPERTVVRFRIGCGHLPWRTVTSTLMRFSTYAFRIHKNIRSTILHTGMYLAVSLFTYVKIRPMKHECMHSLCEAHFIGRPRTCALGRHCSQHCGYPRRVLPPLKETDSRSLTTIERYPFLYQALPVRMCVRTFLPVKYESKIHVCRTHFTG